MKEEIVQIGSIPKVLVDLTPFSQQIILDGFKMAFLNRHVQAKGSQWEFVEIYFKQNEPYKIMARVQEKKSEEEQAA